MPNRYISFDFQCKNAVTGEAIVASGGTALVVATGGTSKATLYDPTADFASLTNPITLTRGRGRFAVADTVGNVDIYLMAPEGQFLVVENVGHGYNPAELTIDVSRREQMLVHPYTYVDAGTGTTEYDTGFDFPTNALILPWSMGVRVVATDATEVLDVGLLASESGGDADGFMADIPISGAAGTALAAKGAMTVGSNETFFASMTYGALVATLSAGNDVATDVGGILFTPHRIDGTAKSLSYTPSSWDTATGFFYVPYVLFNV